MANQDDLPFGLYERLITAGLKSRLLRFDRATARVVRDQVDPAEAHEVLARHVEVVVSRALRGLPGDERTARQVELANAIVRLVAGDPEEGVASAEDVVEIPPEQLRAIQAVTGLPGGEANIVSPLVPLSASDLLVNARGEPGLARNLAMEIPSADSIDLLCAFVRWHGLRVLEDQLAAHGRAGKRLRVITTVYTGSTERKALDWLVRQGAQVKVSYDTESTRLHAKAWLFRRATGFSTAYIGSSNVSKSALVDGVEWNVRLSQVGSPDILEKFSATFESYWNSPDYEEYQPERDRVRLDRALAGGRRPQEGSASTDIVGFLDVVPWPHQTDMLEKLAVERERHGRFRNLVVAATGTGKTMVAALDYKRLRQERGDLSLLFVAHRQELLRQSVFTFRQVLRSGDFGELYVDGHRPDEWRHVFASIQSLSQLEPDQLRPDAFDMVIVDEFHHAAAPTYRRLLDRLSGDPTKRSPPQILLGLTATPERTDAEDILHYFDNRVAVELRLWDALERGLLCPFQYFGLHDNTDLSSVRWSRRGYDTLALEHLYTADDARVKLVLQQLLEKHRDPGTMRALGFCVSIAHAEFMARRFSDAGLASQAVSADTDSDTRKLALDDLRAGRVRAVFAVDLFNEGVDLPTVDTLLFLRPTESALVFMQQLGRGLRRHESKDCVTVLDFIGQANRQFRFDLRYRAVTGGSRSEVERQIQQGFPFLPAGCSMQLDRVAQAIVLDGLKTAIPSRRPAMVRELRALMQSGAFRGRSPSLSEFLRETGLELDDVYKGGCWSGLKRDAGAGVESAGPLERELGRRLRLLLHIDDPLRIDGYRRWLTSSGSTPEGADARLAAALMATLFGDDMAPTLIEGLAAIQRHPAIALETLELLDLLEDRAEHLTSPLELSGVPLSVHARHSLVDVLAAFGRIAPGRYYQHREGTYRDEASNSDLFFVTLVKSERDYSPSTRYRDYAISPTDFHWESQSTTTQRSETGQRYIHHRARGGHILLFVREHKELDGRTQPYTFLGPADYVSHTGERPISFVWRLRRAMPADFFRQARVAAG